MEPHTERVVLILADISGYTRFMLASQEALVHGQQLITELLESIIAEVEIPLEVNKIEGDAVFLYAIKPDDDAAWLETRRLIGHKLVAFFEAFSRTILEVSESALCPCAVCSNVGELKLKVAVHSGEALFHHVGSHAELAGVDVILAHRLLKNSIASDEYVLMTEAAFRDIEFPMEVQIERGEEWYEGFGAVATRTWLAKGGGPARPDALAAFYARPGAALARHLHWLAKGYFGQLPILLGLRPAGSFAEIDELPVRPAARLALAASLILLAPLLVPLGAGVQAWRIFTRRRANFATA